MTNPKYREFFLTQYKSIVQKFDAIPCHGPGTELKNLLKMLGFDPNRNCECESRAREMNCWGVEGCRQKRQEIIDWLQDSSKTATWRETLSAGLKAAANGLFFRINPLDLYGSLVDEAIRRAEINLHKNATNSSIDSSNQ